MKFSIKDFFSKCDQIEDRQIKGDFLQNLDALMCATILAFNKKLTYS